MNNSHILRKHPVLSTVTVVSASLLLFAWLLGSRLVIQVTSSMPRGIYWIETKVDIPAGAIVVFEPPPAARKLMDERGWWNISSVRYSLMKTVIAEKGDHVKVTDDVVFVNGSYFGPVKRFDSQGLPLTPYLADRVLSEGEYFAASTYHSSFDSRYFGTIRRDAIFGVARRIF
jgi:conjugative transfer signal peptidase TraF